MHFFAKKVDDLFLVVALKDRLNIPPNLTRPAKTVLKILTLAGGALRVLGGALTHFPCKLCLENFFSPPWAGAGAPTQSTAPPGSAYVESA